LLLLKIKEAQTEKAKHGAAFEEFDSVISSENCMAWKAEMEAWEENLNDTTVTNPLELKGICKFGLISLWCTLLNISTSNYTSQCALEFGPA
jgi:hypothetical protein